jgi:tRNA(Ile)-lysidine synthase
MLKEFLTFIKKEKLFSPSQKILLAVSGGVDSVAMCELFHKAGLKFGIVHCNFNLRGSESDGDEMFVNELAVRYEVEFHFEQFETKSYARRKGISIQMAARELRYTFFESVRKKFGYDYIATAHHKSDVMETMLLNLARGTGISGLHGILPKRESIVRPILFASREEIARFVSDNRLPYREDSSNKSEKYLRNLVRKKIVPVLKKINSDAENSFYQSSLHVRNAEKLLFDFVDEFKKKNVSVKKNIIFISINTVISLTGGETILFELLKPFGFTPDVVGQIFESAEGTPGKQFLSPTHRLIRDRKNFVVTPLMEKPAESSQKVAKVPADVTFNEEVISFSVKDKKKFAIPKTSAVCCVDYDKLKFPLTIRSWSEGDSFIPLGMKHHRKVSDFLIDKKIPLHEKEKVKVIESNKEIICLTGLRINDRYRVTEKTKRILIVQEGNN